ncbi:MAG: hypothetical protein P4N41_14410 [Negativicutes bacterium]|nr:hypothetical protein [Negativicutes bacterium]
MARGNTRIFLTAFLAAALLLPVALASPTGGESRGGTDWGRGVVRATGTGVPPTIAHSPAQANAMARRAAVVDAYRNLLEAVGEVRVEAATVVKNFAVESDVVRTRISGLVQGARVVSEQTLADGSCQVTLEVSLFGEDSVAAAIEERMKPDQVAPIPAPSSGFVPPANPAAAAPLPTGVVVDAQGLGLQRVMSPRIYDPTGRIIYGNMYIDPDLVVQRGMADYLTAEDAAAVAAGRSRAGASPIVVRAVGLKNFNADAVISQADADRILVANARSNFLARTAVVFEQ